MFRVRLDTLVSKLLENEDSSDFIRVDGHLVRWERRKDGVASFGGIVVGISGVGSIPCTATIEYTGDDLRLRDHVKGLLLESEKGPTGQHRLRFPEISWWMRLGGMDKTHLVITPAVHNVITEGGC